MADFGVDQNMTTAAVAAIPGATYTLLRTLLSVAQIETLVNQIIGGSLPRIAYLERQRIVANLQPTINGRVNANRFVYNLNKYRDQPEA